MGFLISSGSAEESLILQVTVAAVVKKQTPGYHKTICALAFPGKTWYTDNITETEQSPPYSLNAKVVIRNQ